MPRKSVAQLVDISKLNSNGKIKEFSHTFICRTGYSPPSGGESLFVSSLNNALSQFMPRKSAAQLVDISKLNSNGKIKEFSHTFICRTGYSPPSGANRFLSPV